MEERREIDLAFDKKYLDLRNKIAEKYFGGLAGCGRDTCLFALSLGIRYDLRAPKKSWSKSSHSWSDLNRLSSEIGDFGVLFDYMDLNDGDMSTKARMDEFVTGGLRFMSDNALDEDGSLVEIVLD